MAELKVGEVAEPVRSGAGFHILKLTDKRGNTVKFLDQTLARHILVQPSEIRTEKQAELLINDIFKRLQEGEDFKQLARQFSEDPGSKMDGGDLGWNNPGDYDPAFEKTLNPLLENKSLVLTSSIPYRVSGLSVPKRSIDSCQVILGNGVWRSIPLIFFHIFMVRESYLLVS